MTKECDHDGGTRGHGDGSDESGMPFYKPTQFRLALSLLVSIITMNLTWVVWKKKDNLAPYQFKLFTISILHLRTFHLSHSGSQVVLVHVAHRRFLPYPTHALSSKFVDA